MRVLNFIVMGDPLRRECDESQMIFAVRLQVLIETHNTGRPPSDFEIRDATGQVIDPLTLVRDLPEGEIWITPRMGCGGSHKNYRRKIVPVIANGHLRSHGRAGTRWGSWMFSHARIWRATKRDWERRVRRRLRLDLASYEENEPTKHHIPLESFMRVKWSW